jgi:hypothetical protein
MPRPKGKLTAQAKADLVAKQKATIEKNKLAKQNQLNNSDNTQKPPVTMNEAEDQNTGGAEATKEENNNLNSAEVKNTEQPKVEKASATTEIQPDLVKQLLDRIEKLEATKNQPSYPAERPLTETELLEKQKIPFGKNIRREIPLVDRLEKAVEFTVVGGLFIYNSYFKDGTRVYAPYDMPVKFIPNFSDIKTLSTGEKINCKFSKFATHSKKVCDYIRNSPLFGRTIYSSQSEALKVNYEILDKIKMAGEAVMRLNELQVLNMADNYHLSKAGKTTDAIRNELINIKIAEMIQGETDATKKTLASLNAGKEIGSIVPEEIRDRTIQN